MQEFILNQEVKVLSLEKLKQIGIVDGNEIHAPFGYKVHEVFLIEKMQHLCGKHFFIIKEFMPKIKADYGWLIAPWMCEEV